MNEESWRSSPAASNRDVPARATRGARRFRRREGGDYDNQGSDTAGGIRGGRRLRRRAGALRGAPLLRLPRLALDAAGADDRAAPAGAALDAYRRALGRLLRPGDGEDAARTGGPGLHLRYGGGQLPAGGRRGVL